jgi:hypothetical protein
MQEMMIVMVAMAMSLLMEATRALTATDVWMMMMMMWSAMSILTMMMMMMMIINVVMNMMRVGMAVAVMRGLYKHVPLSHAHSHPLLPHHHPCHHHRHCHHQTSIQTHMQTHKLGYMQRMGTWTHTYV